MFTLVFVNSFPDWMLGAFVFLFCFFVLFFSLVAVFGVLRLLAYLRLFLVNGLGIYVTFFFVGNIVFLEESLVFVW